MKTATPILLLTLVTLVACGRPMVTPVVQTGDVIPPRGEAAVADAAFEIEARRAGLADESARIQADAIAECRGDRCRALAERRLVPGMSETEVMAVTGTTPDAWERRVSGPATVLVPRDERMRIADGTSEVAFVSMSGGRLATATFRDVAGFRVVAEAADATDAEIARARAEGLVRQGDALAAAGDFVGSLDRYDRADVLSPGDPEITLRIAQALDKQLRPYEAAIRYRLFIHQLEMERLYARGEIAARMAEAIARARERIVVIERR